MEIKIPEKHKQVGVRYAVTDKGWELPVIDVTHPAFRMDPSTEDLDRRVRKFMTTRDRMERWPPFLKKALWGIMRRRSRLAAGLVRAEGTDEPPPMRRRPGSSIKPDGRSIRFSAAGAKT